MKCPRCADSLTPEVRLNTEVDVCLKCEGIWLDKGEGEPLTRPDELPEEVVKQIVARATPTPAEPDASAALTCPRCEKTMERETYADSTLEIDRCECGVWLDKGELGKIATYRVKVMEELKTKPAGTADGDGFDFPPQVLEQFFARIYFDVGIAVRPEDAS